MLRFSATLILTLSIAISATLTVRFMMMQGANSEIDMTLNVGMGLILAIAEVVFAAMMVYLYDCERYFLSILFLFTIAPLVLTSITASNLQLLDSQSKTEHHAMVNDTGYNALLQMQRSYSEQISEIKSHPFYNEHNPINKKRFDEQIDQILAKQETVSQQIANFNPATLESGNGFQVMGEWLGMSANQFKQNVFFITSILLEVVMLLCTIFLTVTTPHSGKNSSPGGPSNRPRKGLFRKLFSSFKLPSIVQQPTSQPSGARALNIQENINSEYSRRNADGQLAFKVSDDGNINASLDEFPHIIIAGRTGSGKSNFTRAMLLQLLNKNGPKQLQLIIIDLKNAEFFMYESLPHLMKPILSTKEPNFRERAIEYLTFLENEVSRRQAILYDAGCRDYQSYLSKNKSAPYPYLLVIIEEISIISTNKQIQERLRNLTSLARSTGTSIVVTTQYPYARVIGTDITGNCGGKFCFKVETIAQSLTILGSRGAEILKGSGHGIFSNNGDRIEFQAPLVDDSYEETLMEKYSKPSNIIPFHKNIQNIPDNSLNIQENIPDENIPLVERAKKLRQEGKKQTEIGEILGIPQGTVSKLLRRA